jgi:hypothetical protein
MFVDAAAFDFRLKVGSPTIDAGVDLSERGLTVDFAGNKRPQGKRSDIGAYEFK